MKELIGVAVLIAAIFGGTIAAEKIFDEVRLAALAKAAKGLPRLSPFARAMTRLNPGPAPRRKREEINRRRNLDARRI